MARIRWNGHRGPKRWFMMKRRGPPTYLAVDQQQLPGAASFSGPTQYGSAQPDPFIIHIFLPHVEV